jgi:hypothetical protein
MRRTEGAMADTTTAQQKCAHPSCNCKVPHGTKYCSDYCRNAPEIDLHCDCKHIECRV